MLRWYTLIGFLYCSTAYGQLSIDTLLLPAVQVHDTTSSAGIGRAVLDKEQLLPYSVQSVAEVLQGEGLAYLKSYGVGNIATVSLRGGTASQTAVLWEGVPIQSPMLGLQDLSLVATGLFDQLTLTTGGSSTIHGASGVTGALNLQHEIPDTSFRLISAFQLGSFGNLAQQVRTSIGTQNWRVRLSGQHRQMENDYPVTPSVLWGADRLPHAAIQQWSAMGEIYYVPSAKQQFSLRYWHQANDRQLPPTTLQRRSLATQDDEGNRLLLSWQGITRRGVHKAQLAWLRESTNYMDAQQGFVAPSQYDTYFANWQSTQQRGQSFRWTYGAQAQYTTAEATGYRRLRSYYRLAMFNELQWQIPNQHLTLAWSARLAAVSTEEVFPGTALRISGQIVNPNWQYSVRLARDYRLPGLNDLFWIPGGNENLATETAWVQEGQVQRIIPGKGQLTFGLFNRWTRNWIQWSQTPSGFFAVDNINKVWSRGATIDASYKRGKLKTTLRYQLALSTYGITLENPNVDVGDQLWYTPVHQITGNLKYTIRSWQVSYQHQWQSATIGINADLADFALGQINLSHRFRLLETELHTMLSVQNLYNTDYEVVEFRPMPGRNIQLQFALKI